MHTVYDCMHGFGQPYTIVGPYTINIFSLLKITSITPYIRTYVCMALANPTHHSSPAPPHLLVIVLALLVSCLAFVIAIVVPVFVVGVVAVV